MTDREAGSPAKRLRAALVRPFVFGLAPGIGRDQVWILAAMFIAARCACDFLMLMQPFVLNEQLHVPRMEQGRLTGTIGSVQQIVLLLAVAVVGPLADRFGRRVMMMLALGGLAALSMVFPLVTSIAALVALRILYGLVYSAYTAGGVPLIHDFPDNASRGRFLSFVIVLQLVASTILVGFAGARLPGWLIAAGLDTLAAGRVSFLICAALALAGLSVTWWGFREPPVDRVASDSGGLRATLSQLGEVVACGRKNRRFGMLIVLSFVTRADSAIISTFLALWVVNAGAARGIGTATAMGTAGTLLVVLNVASFVMPPLFGALADKFDRAPMLLFSLAAGGIAFFGPLVVSGPFGWGAIATVVLIGIAEGAQTVSSQAMFGQEAPPHLRASGFALFTIFGSISVVAVTAVGGLLFDSLGYGAPFALVGVLNFLFLAIVGAILRKGRAEASLSCK